MTDDRKRRAQKSEQIGVRVRREELDALRELAEEEGRTVSGQIRYFVRRALAEKQADARA